jgi:hypothetical protein
MAKLTALTDEEKRVIKALIADGMRNQDIHTLVNYEREATINFGRIAGVKKTQMFLPPRPKKLRFLEGRSAALIVSAKLRPFRP